MNKETYIADYDAHIDKSIHIHDLGDNCFCNMCLYNLSVKEPTLIDALIAFDLKPENLATIIDSIGGAEYYEFNHIRLIKWLLALYEYHAKGTDLHSQDIPYLLVTQLLEREFLPEQIKLLPPIPQWRITNHHNNDPSLSMDIALGHLIHAEHFFFLHDTLHVPPSGDDTYFDYYPGAIFYFHAITEWFINSANRLA